MHIIHINLDIKCKILCVDVFNETFDMQTSAQKCIGPSNGN